MKHKEREVLMLPVVLLPFVFQVDVLTNSASLFVTWSLLVGTGLFFGLSCVFSNNETKSLINPEIIIVGGASIDHTQPFIERVTKNGEWVFLKDEWFTGVDRNSVFQEHKGKNIVVQTRGVHLRDVLKDQNLDTLRSWNNSKIHRSVELFLIVLGTEDELNEFALQVAPLCHTLYFVTKHGNALFSNAHSVLSSRKLDSEKVSK